MANQDKLFNNSISLLQEIKFSFQKAKQISPVAWNKWKQILLHSLADIIVERTM